MGENKHGIEPESSEQGTFSKNHIKTRSAIVAQDKIKKKMGYWSSIGDQENKEIYKTLVCYSDPRNEIGQEK